MIDQVRLGIGSDDGTNANVQQSDISNYVVPFAHNVQPFGAGTLGCNWWGSPAGPFGGTPDPIYVPWAIAPIANGAGGACTGN